MNALHTVLQAVYGPGEVDATQRLNDENQGHCVRGLMFSLATCETDMISATLFMYFKLVI